MSSPDKTRAGISLREEGARKTVVTAVALPGLDLPEPEPAATEALPEPTPPENLEHPLVRLLRELQPEALSPLEALRLLMEWKKLWADAPQPAPSATGPIGGAPGDGPDDEPDAEPPSLPGEEK